MFAALIGDYVVGTGSTAEEAWASAEAWYAAAPDIWAAEKARIRVLPATRSAVEAAEIHGSRTADFLADGTVCTRDEARIEDIRRYYDANPDLCED